MRLSMMKNHTKESNYLSCTIQKMQEGSKNCRDVAVIQGALSCRNFAGRPEYEVAVSIANNSLWWGEPEQWEHHCTCHQ